MTPKIDFEPNFRLAFEHFSGCPTGQRHGVKIIALFIIPVDGLPEPDRPTKLLQALALEFRRRGLLLLPRSGRGSVDV